MSKKNVSRAVVMIAVTICAFAAVGVAEAANIIKGVFVNAETGEYLVSPVYVSKSGSDANSGVDWEHAKLTIQAGIDAASAGGVVLVGPGDYSDTVSHGDGQTVVLMNKQVYLKSAEGKGATFITGAWGQDADGIGTGATRGVRITAVGAVVDGFTIRNCAVSPRSGGNNSTSCGAGVCGSGGQVSDGSTSSASYVVNSTIENCRGYHGAAVKGVVAINCLFRGNVAVNDGHVGYRIYSVYNCIFTGNGNGTGRLIEKSAPFMSVNCTYLLNDCDTFVGAASSELGRAINCAFIANTLEDAPTSNFYATNCIGNKAYQLKTNGTGCKDWVSVYQYFSPAEWDFTPVAGSDSLDGGSDEALASVAWIPDDFRVVDFNGNPRKVGTAVDIGAVEAPEGGAVIAYSPIGIGAGVALAVDGEPIATPEVVGAWYAITDSTPKMVRVTSTLAAGKELFSYNISKIKNENGWNGYRYPDKLGDGGAWLMPWNLSEGGFTVSAKEATDVKIVGAGETYETINAAITAGSDWDVIKVKPGTYTGTVYLYGHRAIRAVGTPEETIIVGGTDTRCVYVDTSYKTLNVHLQGFTLTGSNNKWSGGGFTAALNTLNSTSNHVGRAECDSCNAQVTDCIISNNCAASGSAVYGGWAQRCLIVNNSANSSRQIAVNATVLSACVIIDNTTSTANPHEQLFGASAYNCTIIDTNPNHDSNRKQFDQLGLYNCCIVGGLLPWPSASYEKALGCVSIGSWQYEGSPGLRGVEIFSDPNNDNLADKAGGDYRIRAGSYALRYGSITPPNLTRFAVGDFNSKPLFFYNNSTPIPGAYQVPAPVVSVASTASTAMDPVASVVPAAGRVEAGDTVTITRASKSRPEFGYVVDGVTNTTAELTYTYTIPNEPSAEVTTITPIAIPCDLYVDPSKSDGNTGWTAEAAKKTLVGVMKIAVKGDVVHAAAGEYAEGETTNTVSVVGTGTGRGHIGCRVNVPAGVTLRAEGGRDETIIKGRYHSASSRWGTDALRAVFLEPNAIIDGFTIRDGATRGGAGYGQIYDDNHGGCVAAATVVNPEGPGVIRNCTIFGGGARTAGGVCGGIVDHCYIYGCTSASDASASAYSRIENSVIYNESNTTVNYHFGIMNSTIIGTGACSDNEMRSCLWESQSHLVANSIIIVPGYSSQKYVTYTNWNNCVIQPTSSNSRIVIDENACHNIVRATAAQLGLNPAAGNFLPAVDSVAIDAGDNTLLAQLLSGDGTDYVGAQRIYNRTVDVGALEYDWRETYARTLTTSQRFSVTSADPEVAKTGNAVEVFDGVLDVACNAAGSTVNLGVEVVGNGTLTLFMGENAVATFTKGPSQTYALSGTAARGLTNLRFEYAKAEGDERGALLSGFARNAGTKILFR